MKKAVKTGKAAQPIGPFSQGIVVDNWVFVSGMGGPGSQDGESDQHGLKGADRKGHGEY